MQQLPYTWFDHRTDVPQWVAAGIGRAAIEWSVLERELEQLIHVLLDVDIQPARILVNRMNARTRLATAANLVEAHVYNSKLPPPHLKELNKLWKKIEAIQTKRDMLAHGLWTKRNSVWSVLQLRQATPTPELAPDLNKLSRAVIPKREAITRDRIRSIAKEIVGAAKEVQALHEKLEGALAPSRYTRPSYSRKRYGYR